MSAKQGVMMEEKDKSLFQDIRGKVTEFRRKVLRLYLQYINPKLGKVAEVVSEPRVFVKKLLPADLGKWLAIAAGVTGFLVLIKPEVFWYWQIALFLGVFILGPVLIQIIYLLKSKFYNLHVAYPGKHLLGQDFVLDQAINDGTAEMVLHGEKWIIRGDDCAAGSKVRVIAIKDGVLFVTSMNK